MSSTRLLSCTTNPKSMNGFMECSVFNAYVQVGDFVIVAKNNGSSVVGKLIDVSNLKNICIDEIDIEGANNFFLDNGEDDNKKYTVYFRFRSQWNLEQLAIPLSVQ